MKSRRKRTTSSYDFNDSDQLVLFLYRMSELENRSYLKKFMFVIDKDKCALTDVDQELFDAFILTFRHFYATTEPTEMGKIHNILKRSAIRIGDLEAQKAIEEAKHKFDNSPTFRFEMYDENLIVRETYGNADIFDLYLNCRYFHTDVRGARFFFQLPEEHRKKCHDLFQISIVRYIQRLRAYVPIAASLLERGVLDKGGFSSLIGVVGSTTMEDRGKGAVSFKLPVHKI